MARAKRKSRRVKMHLTIGQTAAVISYAEETIRRHGAGRDDVQVAARGVEKLKAGLAYEREQHEARIKKEGPDEE